LLQTMAYAPSLGYPQYPTEQQLYRPTPTALTSINLHSITSLIFIESSALSDWTALSIRPHYRVGLGLYDSNARNSSTAIHTIWKLVSGVTIPTLISFPD